MAATTAIPCPAVFPKVFVSHTKWSNSGLCSFGALGMKKLTQSTLGDFRAAAPKRPIGSIYPEDATRFGPSCSGERGTGGATAKRPQKKADFKDFKMGVFKDGKDYWEHRSANFNRKPEDTALYAGILGGGISSSSSPPAPLFKVPATPPQPSW